MVDQLNFEFPENTRTPTRTQWSLHGFPETEERRYPSRFRYRITHIRDPRILTIKKRRRRNLRPF